MQHAPTIDERRSFLKSIASVAAGGLLSAMGLSGCGPAHYVGKKWGICCDTDYKGPHPKPGAPLVGASGAEFDEDRLIEKINAKERIFEFDDDLFGFVNSLYRKMHGFPVPGHLTYEFSTSTLGNGIVGRYIAGHLIIAPGLQADVCIHILMHEIGHDFDSVTFSENVAEFEAVRGTLESLVAYPNLNKETDHALLRYSNDWSANWSGADMDLNKYAVAAYLWPLAIIRNGGDLAKAQNDINFFYLSIADAKRARDDNYPLGQTYVHEEMKDMAMAAWLDLHEASVPAGDVLKLVSAMRERKSEHGDSIVLPPGLVIPASYGAYLSRPIEP